MTAQFVPILSDPEAKALTRNQLEDTVYIFPDKPVMVATGNIHVPYLPVRAVSEGPNGELVLEL